MMEDLSATPASTLCIELYGGLYSATLSVVLASLRNVYQPEHVALEI